MAITEHPNLITCAGGTKVWRYIDLGKFRSMLETNSLFFCRADEFSDIFEGSQPEREYQWKFDRQKQHAERYNLAFDEEHAWKNVEGSSASYKRLRRATVVNCWHMNENESAVMWGAYLKDTEGVVIQTNAQSLINSFSESPLKIYSSVIRYLDYNNDIYYHEQDYPHAGENTLIPLIHKKREYQGEQEFRLFHEVGAAQNDENYWDAQPSYKGMLIECGIVGAIEQVVFHPSIKERPLEEAMQLVAQYGLQDKVGKSSMTGVPKF